ncbi:flap endonuclease GEN [Euwallacea fornicatus]|uniref:flap endonuclease GEN n=1 Tax=Euwallacea fornicatus TaxID=995702 RepID=UPI00338DDC4D
MGIKDLWSILDPFCERRPLYELQNKTLAIDLSCWICEAQNVADYQVQPRMYLRNLYFRTCYLLLMNVSPVFVLEGKAPELKYDTISARNAVQFKGAKAKTAGVKTGKDRSRFHFVLKQCEEMLNYMGLACVKGQGEAESFCAYLNEDGLVDGCISQDSDCFAYGAKVVYRNFSISTQGTQVTSGGSVDVYDIRVANERLNFGRNKIVAMALLIGSDYSEGVHGIGKTSVLKFFNTVSDEEVLNRLRSWRQKENLYTTYKKQLNDKSICSSCGHKGKVQSHAKSGCEGCKTTKGCEPFEYKEDRLNTKNEIAMRSKALEDPHFPDENLIQEFLVKKDNVKQLDLKWKQPNLKHFVNFAVKFLQWEELYAFEKMLPVLTRWQCRNPEFLEVKDALKGVVKPERIKKVRNPKGVPSYEIIWSDNNDELKDLVPEDQIASSNTDKEKLWSTIEPQLLVEKAYPELVEQFKQSKVNPKKVREKRKRDVKELSEQLQNVSISQPLVKKLTKSRIAKTKNIDVIENPNSSIKPLNTKKAINTNTRKHKAKKVDVAQKTLDTFVKKATLNSYSQKATLSPIEKYSTPVKGTRSEPVFDLDMSLFSDESDGDLSDIVDKIISKNQAANKFKNIAENYLNNQGNADITALNKTQYSHISNSASFFTTNPGDDVDMFERDFNETYKDFRSDTEEYEFDDDSGEEVEHPKELDSDDSFCEKNYIPLYDRLKLKINN